ncbi:type IV secretory system conjugative DNA transfer family protein [Puniceibacterium sp. IMCC21224]|uniref:type IV secretory system conjugative DNA transfer family protein n=1 Tax=Puniceibacterium sp. IMCC21224 TaxID=1618204 RepID=UPI00064E0274|nr:type IV secretory system conjugative DNA transfer family protein [Puniceibacterium sp. IMCC21224]KMK66008.1 Type IV secretory system Conjugative DNA transfer [Puniceibacterium sp. IMCC21224]
MTTSLAKIAYRKMGRSGQIGFGRQTLMIDPQTPVHVYADSHSILLGPTGSGKTTSGVIPRLLDHPGAAFVIDVKGELYHTTAKARAQMGQEVLVLDPFGLLGVPSFALNPLAMVAASPDPDNVAWQIVDAVSPTESLKDPFWDNNAKALIVGLVQHFVAQETAGRGIASLSRVSDLIRSDDAVYNMAVLLDKDQDMPAEAHRSIAAVLSMPEITRGGVLATAVAMLRLFGVRQIRAATSDGDIPLSSISDGDPITLYIVMPPATLRPYGSILRLWMDTILTALFQRETIGAEPTLLAIDEAASLGRMTQLETAFALGRGYGMSVMAVFQTLHQMKSLYGDAHRVLLDNAGAILAYPPANRASAEEIAALVGGVSPEALMGLDDTEVLVARSGQLPEIGGRYDVRFDPDLLGKATPNPRHQSPNSRPSP